MDRTTPYRQRGRPRVYASNAERQRNYRRNATAERRSANNERQQQSRQNEDVVQRAERLAANSESQRRLRQNESAEARASRLIANAERERNRRANETVEERFIRVYSTSQRDLRRRQNESNEERSSRLLANARLQQRRRNNESSLERRSRLSAHAQLEQHRRQNENAAERSTRLLANAQRQQRRRHSENTEERSVRLSANAQRQQRRRQNEDFEQRTDRLRAEAELQRLRRQHENIEERSERLRTVAQRLRRRRENEDMEQQDLRHHADAERHRRVRRAPQETTGLALRTRNANLHSLGALDRRCVNCGALHFAHEVKPQHPDTFGDCCDFGRFNLDLFDGFPHQIRQLYIRDAHASTEERHRHKNFIENIRSFNSALAMASMGASVDMLGGRGPYCYRIHGQIYHRLGALHPDQGERQYGQIYILDTELAAQQRLGNTRNASCDPQLMHFLSGWFAQHNVYAQSFKMMSEVEQAEIEMAEREGRRPAAIRMVFEENRERGVTRGQYAIPTANEVAVVYVGEDNDVPASRSLAIHLRETEGAGLINISDIDKRCDLLTYPLLFPTGNGGWDPTLTDRLGVRITQMKYYSYLFSIRDSFNPILRAGKLFQQFAVDAYVKIEQNRLNYHRTHQRELRSDSYRGLRDYLAGEDNSGPPGNRIILASSHIGSPRAMQQSYQDAMGIVARYGKPTYFLTITCNPQWREIQENLYDGQVASDRPDLVARVFNGKLKELCDDLLKKNVLGEVEAYVYVIEFQKRGLPHCHMLLIMKEGWKVRTVEEVDNAVCAELPNPEEEPEAYAAITAYMIHRKCGVHDPHSPCMRDAKCSKRFPKQLQCETSMEVDGYPRYRRRNLFTAEINGNVYTDEWVVPTNLYLLTKFNCHINLEICGTISAVKYLYKYIYKGPDRARITIESELDDEGNHVVDEIKQHLNTPRHGWRQRRRGGKEIGRMYTVSPRDVERYSLRILLLNTKGKTSFEDLRTVEGRMCETFSEAAKASGFLDDDTYFRQSLREAAQFQTPSMLRGFFACLLCYCEVVDAQELWEEFSTSMTDDYLYRGMNEEEALAAAYFEVADRMLTLGRDLRQIVAPPVEQRPAVPDVPIDHRQYESEGSRLYASLNANQKRAADDIIAAMDRDENRCFFVDGPGGSGKTYLYSTIYNIAVGRRQVVLCVAWTGIAANLLPGGRTVNSAFKLNMADGNRTSLMKRQQKEARQLMATDIIIWDEISMAPKCALEAVDLLLRDIMQNDKPFGGKLFIIGGDFRQVLPIVEHGRREDVVDACVKRSVLWSLFKVHHLQANMRARDAGRDWHDFLLDIGNAVANDAEGRVHVREELICTRNIVTEIFGETIDPSETENICERAILAPKNVHVRKLNDEALERLRVLRPQDKRVYKSVDEAQYHEGNSGDLYPTEYLNVLEPPGMPPHELRLKKGTIVMLLRNLDVVSGLCNGTRLKVETLGRYVLGCPFICGDRKNQLAVIPRIDNYWDNHLPFRLRRRQFPLRVAFAMTINKSQGQSFNRVGVYLPEDVFSHGQLYVALSRGRTPVGIKVQTPFSSVKNIVYEEVLQ
ncbi:hypothetical protein ANCCEY_11605 [Ancylostoma ceylanicum]|uniref:ATP-dependent DNA helicase n=1 Tax=Ancylostoma ceylanicum TaxID=53326 RepID=A0A0D6LB86_9BILA|nr:hypothetical protein ANCCEY_11605 [Ancylostoma ceylanicum]